jgi:polar amino acid transport system substrate-binding protein
VKRESNVISLVAGAGFKIKSGAAAFLIAGCVLGSAAKAQPVAIPNFFSPSIAVERPDLTGFRAVRFLVDDEFPPLAFADADGNPTGFSVELARAVCEKLALTCTVQVRRFNGLLDALAAKDGDVVAAAFPITASLRQRFAISAPYFRIPARFVAQKDKNQPEPTARNLAGKKVAVVGGTAHEAFIKSFMPEATLAPAPDLPAARKSLQDGSADYLFADGVSLALWIGGTEPQDCCSFIGGPYLESRFFGEGIGLIIRQDDDLLRRALDYALAELWKEGKYAELYLRFFPVSPY